MLGMQLWKYLQAVQTSCFNFSTENILWVLPIRNFSVQPSVSRVFPVLKVRASIYTSSQVTGNVMVLDFDVVLLFFFFEIVANQSVFWILNEGNDSAWQP